MLIKPDQTLIEGGIMEAVEGDAVPGVEAFCFMIDPREDVGGDEEITDGQAGQSTAIVIVVEHRIAEITLASTLFGRASSFRIAGWRPGDAPDAGAGDDFGGFGIGIDEEGVKMLLAEGNEFGWILMKILPDLAIQIAGFLKSMDASELQRGIE